MSSRAFTCALAVAVAAAPPASAQPVASEADVAAARAFAARGARHYDLGEYAAAIAAYREAYRRDPRPGLLFNLGQAYRLDGDCVNARAMYRAYLRRDPRTRHRAVVERHLADIESCAQVQEEARAAGHGPVASRPLDDALAAPRDGDPGRGRRVAGLVALGGGVVLAGAGGWFALDARRAADEVEAAYARGADWTELDALDARGRRSELLGVSLLAAGGAALAAGTTLYLLGRRAEPSVAPLPGGAAASLAWRF